MVTLTPTYYLTPYILFHTHRGAPVVIDTKWIRWVNCKKLNFKDIKWRANTHSDTNGWYNCIFFNLKYNTKQSQHPEPSPWRQITKVKPVMRETCCHGNFNAYVLFHTLYIISYTSGHLIYYFIHTGGIVHMRKNTIPLYYASRKSNSLIKEWFR